MTNHVGNLLVNRHIGKMSIGVVELDSAGLVLDPFGVAAGLEDLGHITLSGISVEGGGVGHVGVHIAVVDEGAEGSDSRNIGNLDDVSGELHSGGIVAVGEGECGGVVAGSGSAEADRDGHTVVGHQVVVGDGGGGGSKLSITTDGYGSGAAGGQVVTMGRKRGGASLVDRHVVEAGGALNAHGRVGSGIDINIVDECSGRTLEADGSGTAAGSDKLESGEVALHIAGLTAISKTFHGVSCAVDRYRHGAAIVSIVGIPCAGVEHDADAAHAAQVEGGGLNPAILGASTYFHLSIGRIGFVGTPAGEHVSQRVVVKCGTTGITLLCTAARYRREVFRENRVILRTEGENRHQRKDKKGKDFFHFFDV